MADAHGRVVSSTDPTLIGARLPRARGAGVTSGWSGPLTVQGGRELVAQVPVLGATRQTLGRHLGTVMVGEADPTVWQRLSGASSYLLAYLGVASGLGVAGSWLLARRVKRQTLGLEPREIAGLAEHREAMLYGIAEGVVALDPQHRLTLVNEMGGVCSTCPPTAWARAWTASASTGGCATSSRAPPAKRPSRVTRSSSATAGSWS